MKRKRYWYCVLGVLLLASVVVTAVIIETSEARTVVMVGGSVPAAPAGIVFGNVTSLTGQTDAGGYTAALTAPTISGTNTILILSVTWNTSSTHGETATYNSVGLGDPAYETDVVNYVQTCVWIVINPTSAANFVAYYGDTVGSVSYSMHATYYTGVDQATGYRTASINSSTSADPMTVTAVNSQAGDTVVGIFGTDDCSAADGYTEARCSETFRDTDTNSSNEAQEAICDTSASGANEVLTWDHASAYGTSAIAIPLIPAS